MAMELAPVIHLDQDKCVNCHMCISVCPVKVCIDGSGEKVSINHNLCIGCGVCIEACTHKARTGIDDSDRFWQALERREKLVVIAAPALAAQFPDSFLRLNGWLKSLGVQAFFDVSFGAELTVKSYLEYLKSSGATTIIAQPCPALVTYVELYQSELLPYLAPADSPMLHTIKMIREYFPQYRNHKIAVLSPCVAKRREFDATGLGDYNVTVERILKRLEERHVDLQSYPEVDFDNPPAERAVLFSTPGGLKATVEREVPSASGKIRKIEGPDTVYPYLKTLPDMLKRGMAPLIVDCLNCEKGCNGGTGTGAAHRPVDELESAVEARRRYQADRLRGKGPVPRNPEKVIRKSLNAHWKPGLYERSYVDRGHTIPVVRPNKMELEELYRRMHKDRPEDILNCASCGYNSCEEMAAAIHRGLNRPENCHHYQKTVIAKDRDDLHDLSTRLQAKVMEAGSLTTQIQGLIPGLNAKIAEEYACLHQSTAAVEEMMANLGSSSSIAQKRRLALEKLLESIKSGEEALVRSREGITGAQERVTQIGGLVQDVNGIAEQTNLLSMNAAIEAAHAGNAGRGFAVVASEIRALASKAGESAGVISKSLKDLIQRMSEASELSDTTGTVIKGILNDMEETGTGLSEIFHSMSEMEAGAEQITAGLTQLNETAAGVKNSYKEMEGALGNLVVTIEGLMSLSK